MSSLVIQTPGDLDPVDRERVVDPTQWTIRDDWTTAFEFGGAR